MADEETPCPIREDEMHCNCWYDGKACCACGDAALPEPTYCHHCDNWHSGVHISLDNHADSGHKPLATKEGRE